jgi:hypothetical protein
VPSRRTATALTVLAATAAGSAVAVPAASAATREYEGRVVSVDREARSFRLRDSERGTVRVFVRPGTRFERLAGFGALRAGLRRVEVTVRRSGGRWIATGVERSGGGGEHGGGGGDDHGGDDHGGGRDD